nr:poly(R)-hydroxyalkanoic acid synthase subunit PhaE [Motiliproteus sp. SC1-56]
MPPWRERTREAQKLYRRYRDALQEYLECLRRVNRQTRTRMFETLRTDPPESLLGLHRLWIDCYEHCYHQQLQSEHYQTCFGRLANAALALQQLARRYWEPEYRLMGLVSQQDYSDLLSAHHQLRKQLRQSEQQLAQLRASQESQQQTLQRVEQRLKSLQKQVHATAPEAPEGR